MGRGEARDRWDARAHQRCRSRQPQESLTGFIIKFTLSQTCTQAADSDRVLESPSRSLGPGPGPLRVGGGRLGSGFSVSPPSTVATTIEYPVRPSPSQFKLWTNCESVQIVY